MAKKTSKFKEYGLAFKNPDKAAEDLDEDGLKLEDVESEFFKDDEEFEE